MNTYEPKNRNFIIMILFMVLVVSGAKTLHDVTEAESDQSAIESTMLEEVTNKK